MAETSDCESTAPTTNASTVNFHHRLLDWSAKQSRILTAAGLASKFYVPERGFAFSPEELPHHHLRAGTSYEVFARWASDRRGHTRKRGCADDDTVGEGALVVGAWRRPLFSGMLEHSTDTDEEVFNIQTRTLFVDVRIPRIPKELKLILRDAGSIEALSDEYLRLYARRHAFGGYAVVGRETRPSNTSGRLEQPMCTRHHVIDWNYLPSRPRDRPNKWWIEFPLPAPGRLRGDVWKEWSYATDDFSQHYYFERWERLEDDGKGQNLVLALRKAKEHSCVDGGRDGIVVVVGNHFNYIYGRTNKTNSETENLPSTSCLDFIDQAIGTHNRRIAESYLSIDAGHGTILSGWKIDFSVQPWKEGTILFDPQDEVKVMGSNIDSCHVLWNAERWEVLECSGVSSISDLYSLLCQGPVDSKL